MHKALVVGYGSIGARHARLLTEFGCDVAVVSARPIGFANAYATLEIAVEQHRPEYLVIANQTNRHHQTLGQLAQIGYRGTVLVEKPAFHLPHPTPANQFAGLFVAYNLRFHPALQQLREALTQEEVISVQAYVGQYLPDWRPGTDYRACYSASAEQGGGVLLDLSHDLDYLGWMVGPWTQVAAIGGQLSRLEVNSDDVFMLMAKTARCPAIALQLNYLDRRGRRQLLVNTASHTYEIDFNRHALIVDRQETVFEIERDTTYRNMHAALLNGQTKTACSMGEALHSLLLIEAARTAAAQNKWIRL
jgi:predicted dehydrogenase